MSKCIAYDNCENAAKNNCNCTVDALCFIGDYVMNFPELLFFYLQQYVAIVSPATLNEDMSISFTIRDFADIVVCAQLRSFIWYGEKYWKLDRPANSTVLLTDYNKLIERLQLKLLDEETTSLDDETMPCGYATYKEGCEGCNGCDRPSV